MTAAERLRMWADDPYENDIIGCFVRLTVEQARALADLLDSFKSPTDCGCKICLVRIAVNKAFGVEHE